MESRIVVYRKDGGEICSWTGVVKWLPLITSPILGSDTSVTSGLRATRSRESETDTPRWMGVVRSQRRRLSVSILAAEYPKNTPNLFTIRPRESCHGPCLFRDKFTPTINSRNWTLEEFRTPFAANHWTVILTPGWSPHPPFLSERERERSNKDKTERTDDRGVNGYVF